MEEEEKEQHDSSAILMLKLVANVSARQADKEKHQLPIQPLECAIVEYIWIFSSCCISQIWSTRFLESF